MEPDSVLMELTGGFKVCIHNCYMALGVYTAWMTVTMATIYVRIPRNRWTPIGEIDLDGSQAIRYGWCSGPVHLYPEVEGAIKRTLSLRREILQHARRVHGKKLRKNRRHEQHMTTLLRRLRLASPHRLLQEQAKRTAQKRRKERRR